MAKNRPPLADHADREVTTKTKHFADWLHTQTGSEVHPASVQLALALDKTYRKSDEYGQMVEAHRAERAQAEADRKAAATAKRREAAQRKLEEAQAALAALGESAPTDEVAVKRAAKKAPTKKAAPAKNASAKPPAKKAPAKKATKAASKPATASAPADIDDDF